MSKLQCPCCGRTTLLNKLYDEKKLLEQKFREFLGVDRSVLRQEDGRVTLECSCEGAIWVAGGLVPTGRWFTNSKSWLAALKADRCTNTEARSKLLALLDAARGLAENVGLGPVFRAHALDALEAAAVAWAADECPICGRRGDHAWEELTSEQRLAHEVESESQGI